MPCYNYKKLFLFGKFVFFLGLGQYKKLLLVYLKNSLGQFNQCSVSISMKLFSSVLNQQSSWSIRNVFHCALNQQSSQGLRMFFIFTLGQQSPQNVGIFFFWKNVRNFFRAVFCLFVFWAQGWKVCQVASVFTTTLHIRLNDLF